MDPRGRFRDHLVVPKLAHGLAFVAAASTVGCRPPPMSPGFVSTELGAPRQVDGAVAAGIATVNGDPASIFGGGGIQAEPYATPKLSIPVALASGYGVGGAWGATRLGLRHRSVRDLAFGGGLGPTGFLSVNDEGVLSATVGGAFDLELAAGHRWGGFALSGVARPSFVVSSARNWSWYGIVEVTPAWYVRPRLALTGHVIGGPAIDLEGRSVAGAYGFVGGGLGVFVHL